MNSEKIRQLAENLEKKLMQHMGANEGARKLHGSLVVLINKAKQGLIDNPVDDVPGSYWFLEGGLSEFSDLESAYSEFKNVVTMNDNEYVELREWAERRKKDLFDKS